MYLTESGSVPDADWLALLRPYYDHALLLRGKQLAEQPGGGTEKREEVSDHALASRLGALYLYGLLDLAAGDLLDRYYAQADDDGAASVARVFLHQLRREGQTRGGAQQAAADEEPTEQLAQWVDRARVLWAWRKATVLASSEPDQHGKEAAAFAHLFLLACFDGKECLAVVEDLLPIADLNAWDSALLERLAALAAEAPAACLRVASGFIYRGGYPRHDSTSKVLRAALQGGDKQVQRDARELLNRLLAGGCAGLDDLLALDATPPSSDESAAATIPTADFPE